MRVLVIGSGGREHAICWRLRRSASVTNLWCAPGNPGIAHDATLLPLAVTDVAALAEFALQKKIDLTIVGPEQPLSLGIVDYFQARGLTIFGPTQRAAQLESSKAFAKEVMLKAGVPTAGGAVAFGRAAVEKIVMERGAPIVLKADGLAAGKGVYVCLTPEDIPAALDGLFNELKADKIVIEEYVSGVEASFIVATDGQRIVPLAPSHDYKRIFDNDEGLNTGGMGSVSPTSHLTTQQAAWAVDAVIRPTLQEMAKRGTPFQGFLYAGLMVNPNGQIHVLEFNTRLGDPETQSIMRRYEGDFALLLASLAAPEKNLPLPPLSWSPKTAINVVLAAGGYPQNPTKGDEIIGIELAAGLPDIVVFHAGTTKDENTGKLLTNGGRVLGVSALADDLPAAQRKVYRAADMIQFRGRQARRDIGAA